MKELRENIRKVRKNDAFPCTSSDHNHLKMDNINEQLPTTVYELLIIQMWDKKVGGKVLLLILGFGGEEWGAR